MHTMKSIRSISKSTRLLLTKWISLSKEVLLGESKLSKEICAKNKTQKSKYISFSTIYTRLSLMGHLACKIPFYNSSTYQGKKSLHHSIMMFRTDLQETRIFNCLPIIMMENIDKLMCSLTKVKDASN